MTREDGKTNCETMRRSSNPVIRLLADDWDSGDPYGSAIGALCNVVDLVGALDEYIPGHIATPGMAGWGDIAELRELESDNFMLMALIDAMENDAFTVDDLTRAMRALNLHADRCRDAGIDY